VGAELEHYFLVLVVACRWCPSWCDR